MDALDARILRSMFRGGVYGLHGADPRRTILDIASESGASRLTIRRRLRRWQKDQFFTGYNVYPNPHTVGCELFFEAFHVAPSASFAEVERQVREHPRMLRGYQSADAFGVFLAAPSLRDLRGFPESLERISGVHALFPLTPVTFPRPTGSMRASDWAIVAALRRHRGEISPEVAAEVRFTHRGLRRRVARLLDSNLLYFMPELDLRKSRGALTIVVLLLRGSEELDAIRRAMSERFPDSLEMYNFVPLQYLAPPPIQEYYRASKIDTFDPTVAPAFSAWIPIASVAEVDVLRRELLTLPGVLETVNMIPIHDFEGARWVDESVRAGTALGHSPAATAGSARTSKPASSRRVCAIGSAASRLPRSLGRPY